MGRRQEIDEVRGLKRGGINVMFIAEVEKDALGRLVGRASVSAIDEWFYESGEGGLVIAA